MNSIPDLQPVPLQEVPVIKGTANGGRAPDAESWLGPSPDAPPSAARLTADQFDQLIAIEPELIEAEEVDTQDMPRVGKPRSQDFFRIHPTANCVVALLKLEDSGEYLLCRNTIEHSAVRPYRLYLCRTRKGQLGLWPIPTPREGEDFPAAKSARAAASDAVLH
jgi:hypothetical protein